MSTRKMSLEERWKIVQRMALEGRAAVAESTKISLDTLDGWRRKFRSGHWKAPDTEASTSKPNGSSASQKDAIIYLRHARDAAIADLRNGKAKTLSRDVLYSLLALDALEGR